MTKELRKLISDREKLLQKARKSKRPGDWLTYKRLRNKCTNDIRRIKAKFYRELLNESSNKPKQF